MEILFQEQLLLPISVYLFQKGREFASIISLWKLWSSSVNGNILTENFPFFENVYNQKHEY